MWDSSVGCSHSGFLKNPMCRWWDSLSDTSVVRVASGTSMHTVSDYWCISREWRWWKFHISCDETMRGWLLSYRRRLLNNSTITFTTMPSSRSLLYISLVCKVSHGRLHFLWVLQLQQLIRRFSTMRVNLHISMEVRRQRLLVCRHMSPIKEAWEDCLQ